MATVNPRAVTVSGVNLNTYAYAITTRQGFDATPGLGGSNLNIPGRDGGIWQAKDFEESRLVLELYVNGRDADGLIPSGKTAARVFRENLDALKRLFTTRHALLDVTLVMEDGTSRFNQGEVTAAITPDFPGNDDFALLKVELTFPNPFWRSTTTSANEPTGSATSPRTLAQTAFAGSTAPINDATILVVGPATNPVVMDSVSGAWIKYTGTVASGSVWRVNCATYASEVGSSLGYTGGTATSVIASTTYSPGPRLLPLTPAVDTLTPSLVLSGTGFSTTTTVKVQAYKRFV